MSKAQTTGVSDELCEEIAAAVHSMMGGKEMDEHVETATDALEHDSIVGFQLVAVHETDDGYETGTQRAVSPEAVRNLPESTDPQEFVEAVHRTMEAAYDEDIRGM